MKYIRTYETEEKFLTDKDSASRVFRLKPTLYKYSDVDNGIYLEIDDPRKHEGSTWIRLEFTEATEFSFKISNVTGDDSSTLNYTIDWGDGTVETNVVTRGDDGLYTFSHSYAIGTYNMELYGTDRSYMILGGGYQTYFSTPTAIRRVVLEDEVKIGEYTFSDCTSLTSINIPEGVTSIGGYTFRGCSSLTSINIPEGVTSIGDHMFWGCSSLTSINIPEGVTSIGDSMFQDCSSLSSINLPSTLTLIDRQPFNGCSSLKSINIPEGVTSIGGSAFNGCSSLKSINIPEGVTSIGGSAFSNCTSLKSINLPSTLTSIDAFVFNGCSSLKSINIPEGVTSIGGSAFFNCKSLKSINIPEGVTSIGLQAFFGCTSLTSISSFNTTAPTLGRDPFTSLPTNGTLHIKPGATGYDAWLSKLPSGWTIVEDL